MVFVCEVCLKHFLQNYLRSEINTQISIQTPDTRQQTAAAFYCVAQNPQYLLLTCPLASPPYSSLLMEGTNTLELKVEVAAGWDWRV